MLLRRICNRWHRFPCWRPISQLAIWLWRWSRRRRRELTERDARLRQLRYWQFYLLLLVWILFNDSDSRGPSPKKSRSKRTLLISMEMTVFVFASLLERFSTSFPRSSDAPTGLIGALRVCATESREGQSFRGGSFVHWRSRTLSLGREDGWRRI